MRMRIVNVKTPPQWCLTRNNEKGDHIASSLKTMASDFYSGVTQLNACNSFSMRTTTNTTLIDSFSRYILSSLTLHSLMLKNSP